MVSFLFVAMNIYSLPLQTIYCCALVKFLRISGMLFLELVMEMHDSCCLHWKERHIYILSDSYCRDYVCNSRTYYVVFIILYVGTVLIVLSSQHDIINMISLTIKSNANYSHEYVLNRAHSHSSKSSYFYIFILQIYFFHI